MKKLLVIVLSALMILGVIAGCQKNEPAADATPAPEATAATGGLAEETTPTTAPEAEPQYGGTFVYAMANDPNSLLYAWLESGATNRMSSLINDKLLILDSNGEVEEYRVCDSYEVSEDELTYTFHIREGVKWHDGTPVLASDVCWTVNVARSSDWFMSLQYDAPGEWTAIDDSTFTVTLTEPSTQVLSWAASMHIQPEHYYDGVGHAEFYSCPQATSPIGCGPFKFVEYKVGDYIKFEAFEDFWAGRPYLDQAFIKITGSAQSTEVAFESGQVSAYITTEDYYEEIKDNPQFQFLIGPSSMVAMVDFGSGAAQLYKYEDKDREVPLYFGDAKVREAIAYMIPYEDIIEKVLRGACVRSYTLVPSDGQWYTEEGVTKYYYDLDKANAILDEAGYVDTDGDGIRNWSDGSNMLVVWKYFDQGGSNERMSVLMAENCNACGIGAAVGTEESTSWLETFVGEHDFDISDAQAEGFIYYYGGYSPMAYDYENGYASWGGQSNLIVWETGETMADEDLDRMFGQEQLEQVKRSDECLLNMRTDKANAEEYFHEFQRIHANEIRDQLPIGTMQRRIAFQSNLRGIENSLWRTNNNYLGFAMERIWIDPNA